MVSALRFAWNSTRGYRFRLWRSPHLRWRIETFSGFAAERLNFVQVLWLFWHEKRQILRFLSWGANISSLAR